MPKKPRNATFPSNIKLSNHVEQVIDTKKIDKEELNNIKILLDQERIEDAKARRKLSKSKKTKKTRKVLAPEEKRERVLNQALNEIKKEEVETNVTKKTNSLLNSLSCILEEFLRQIFF